MLSMDCRENINPNTLGNYGGAGNGHSKSIDKTTNSKVIMAKQMMFETMNNNTNNMNLPRQFNNNFFI